MMIFGNAAKVPLLAAIVLVLFATGIARAQNSGSGTTQSPTADGASQPQGSTGPVTTGSGGAPAASPQGDTPPNMQAAPEGSSKSITSPSNQ
jgi:hypothetical protein